MLKYAKSLKFEEEPNYAYLKKLLKDIALHSLFEFDWHFDWINNKAALSKLAGTKVMANPPAKHMELM